MDKRFWIFLLAGLGVIALLIFGLFTGTTGAHLRLEGKILKVRVLQIPGANACVMMVDFRVTNPSDVPFVVDSAKLRMTLASGEVLESPTISKADIETLFQYAKLLGPKYNDVLGLQDRIAPHRSVDRMAGARFEVPEQAIDSRKALTLEIDDVDGTEATIPETSRPDVANPTESK